MKKLISLMLLSASAIGAHASVAVPQVMPSNTNDWPVYALAQHANAIDMRLGYTDGKVDALQRQVEHMQTGFLVLVLVVVVAVIGICILIARKDTTTARATAQEAYANMDESKTTAVASVTAKK